MKRTPKEERWCGGRVEPRQTVRLPEAAAVPFVPVGTARGTAERGVEEDLGGLLEVPMVVATPFPARGYRLAIEAHIASCRTRVRHT
eukprot:7051329-Prymnesium_polylepis.1